jgi:basic membrane protein A
MTRAAPFALAFALIAALAGCGSSSSSGSNASASPTAGQSGNQIASSGKSSHFLACEVLTDTTLYDKSFNEATWNGLQQAQKSYGIRIKYTTAQSPSDFQPNLEAAHTQGCNVIFAISFTYGDLVAKEAKLYPKQHFAIVDYSYSPPSQYPNVRQLVFATDQAAFQAGYLSAGMTKTGKIGTFGGQKQPPVDLFMDGIVEGANYYNHVHHTHVQVLGWNPKTQTGLFTGDFTDEAKGRTTTQSLMGQGADIILPVAGSVGLGTVAAVRAAGRGAVIWVDSDGCKTDPGDCKYFLTTIEKHMAPGAYDTVKAALHGKFKGGLYTGTLKNGGVGIAPYHQWAGKVPKKLQREVAALKPAIISGKIKIGQWK